MKFLNGIDVASQRITNVADPSSGTDAANKQFVENLVNGLDWKASVRVATTANLAALSGLATIDGVGPLVAGDRVLVKNQTTASANGIYVAASGAWARSTDAATSTLVTANMTCLVSEGTTQADTSWTLSANDPIVLGTTALSFVQVGAGITYSAGNGISVASTVISAVGATGITVGAGGIGIDTSVVARKFSVTVGNGASTSIAVAHGLGTQDVVVAVRDASTNVGVLVDWTATDVNTVTLTFAVAPASGAYRVVVHG
jgi:hypothetical protein